MSNELDAAIARVKHLEEQAKLEERLAEAGKTHRSASKEEKDKALRAHDRAAVALAEHRAKIRSEGGPTVGGDAVSMEK